MSKVTVVSHPLVQHKLTKMRDKTTSTKTFRALMRETATLICYEVTRDLPMDEVRIETPVAPTTAKEIAGKKLVFAPILRAGLGMADGMLDLVPSARVAHVGLYRDPESLEAVEYYFKAPQDIAGRLVIVVDPMLATGHSAIAAVSRLKAAGVTDLRFVCLLAAQEGSRACAPRIPTCRSGRPPSTRSSTITAISCRGWAMPGDRTFGTR
jgi:uracil phosphoribosyltransferase